MTGVSIKIDASKAHEQLARMIAAARNPDRLLRKIGAYGAQRTKKRIRQRIPPPTHPYFEELKRRSGMTTGTPLLAMGHLYRSITHEISGPAAVRVGSPDVKARTHQEGSDGIRTFYLYLIPERNADGTIKRNDYGFVLGRITTRADWSPSGAGAAIRQLISIRIRERPFLKLPDATEKEQLIALAAKHLEGEAS